jgi:aspartate/methionine/tyrosine aminotransferase/prephenate dehydratase/prephenate dehydrogenase
MKIGYQGQEDCYSYQVSKKYLSENNELIGFNKFEDVFISLKNQDIDFALLPIENSLGGTLFMNFDLFYQYNIKIHCEFQYNINHSLYALTKKIEKVESVISHPQALQQCINNIKKHNFEYNNYWDTTASLVRIKKLRDKSIACIGPPGLSEKYGLKELVTNFNDQEKNVTRFYLVSLKERELFYNSILKDNLKIIHDKFSGYVIVKDKIGVLSDYLDKFKQNNYNLTKIESRPYLGNDRQVFSYIFYLEGQMNKNSNNNLSKAIPTFNLFGEFPILDEFGLKTNSLNKLKVGIIGFGRFGQFIGEQMVNYGFQVYATSRTNYLELAKDKGIYFLNKEDFLNLKLDVVILATSILSFEDVLLSYPSNFWNNKLVVDVLSVKVYPKDIINKHLANCNILFTHPMFGPDSAKFSWNDKNFVYWKQLIDNTLENEMNLFINFWQDQGCNMIEMSPEEHDRLTANSQFLTHFIGRTLELLDCKNTNVDTDGYKSLIKIKEHSINDSWDLFDALAKYNSMSLETIDKLKYQIFKLEEKLKYPYGKSVKQSETGRVFSKILKLNSEGKEIINSAIGVPSWYPNLEYNSAYSTAKGNESLISQIVKYYHQKYDISIRNNNLLITPGAKCGLYLALKMFTQVGTKWLIPTPYWTSYPDMVELCGGDSIFIETNVEDNWNINLEVIETNFSNNLINGIILCHPNNPTGILYEESLIREIVILAKKYNKFVIVDEVYLSLTNEKSSYAIGQSYKYKNLIVVSSFSKYWAVPGWRVGWILAEDKLISNLVKLQSNIFTCAPNSSQEVCYKLLSDNFSPDLSILRKSNIEISEIFKRKNWILPENKETTMYLFPVNYNVDISKIVDLLLENGLGVISGKPFGHNNAIRLTLPNNLEELEKIKNILNNNL